MPRKLAPAVDNAGVILRASLVAALLLILSSCSPQNGQRPAAAPTVRPASGSLTCPGGDHGLDEAQLGWGFCYPPTWRFRERLQPTSNPKGVDATFDIIVVPPVEEADKGQFGFLIVGTYETGGAGSLREWAARYLGDVKLAPLQWGNATDAATLSGPNPRRIALTPHHVVLMDIREGRGNLDLDSELSKRLASWKFEY